MVPEYAARRVKVHGIKDIVLLGDSGENQRGLRTVAPLLNKEWADSDLRVHFVPDYYGGHGLSAWLERQGETPVAIGRHAGIMDTSELVAIDPKLLRMDKLAPGGDHWANGVSGNPTHASIAYDRKGLEVKRRRSDPDSAVDCGTRKVPWAIATWLTSHLTNTSPHEKEMLYGHRTIRCHRW